MPDTAFKGGTCQYLDVSNTGVKCDRGRNKDMCFDKQDYVQMIEYIIENAYFSFGKQLPTGSRYTNRTGPAPCIAGHCKLILVLL